MAPFAVQLSKTAPIWGRAVAPIAEWVARAFWSTIRKPDAPPATRLTRATIDEQKVRRHCHRQSEHHAEIISVGGGKTIQDRSENCERCSVDDATKNMLDVARIGRQTANGPEAQEKRAHTQRKNGLAQHAWKSSDQPAWLTDAFYSEKPRPPASLPTRKNRLRAQGTSLTCGREDMQTLAS
jgi:hypothetical protein